MIGGGVAGTSCAYHLARAGVPVVLLERTALAAGSSGRSAAFIETQYTEPDRLRMCIYGLRLYRELADSFPLNYRVRGKLLLGRGEGERTSFEGSLRLQQELAFDEASILDYAEIARRFRHLRIDRQEFALYGPGDGYLDPIALCQAYATVAADHGATILPSTEVHSISTRGDSYIVGSDREPTTGSAVVIAAGAWTEPLARLLDLPLPIRGYRRQVGLLAAPELTRAPLVVDTHANAGCLYFRDDGPGRLIAGLHTEDRGDAGVNDPDHYPRTADPEFAKGLAELVAARLRDFPPLKPIGGWAGLYPIAADGRFVIGESRRHPRLFICAGLAGNGIQLSAAAGAIITQLVRGEPQTILPDLRPYHPDRFTKISTPTAELAYD